MANISRKIRRKAKSIKSSSITRSVRSASGKKPKVEKPSSGKVFEGLVALQARLRAPNGCPWDREQTHESLRTYLIEETYEVLDALDSGDPRKLAEELGDLLLQILFHADLAAEAGKFDISDVITAIHSKMVRRHPHVFGTAKAHSAAQVLKNWEQLKAEERRAEQKANQKDDTAREKQVKAASILDAVPRSLPALLEAHQMTRRAANVGFDWRNIDGILEKLHEEAQELREAIREGDRKHQEDEAGDLLFVCVNIARMLGTDAEIALKKTNRKFGSRFRFMEGEAQARGQKLSDLSPEELETLWDTAKSQEV